MFIEVVPTPKVAHPLQQHIGAPSKPLVKPKQTVEYGDLIADNEDAPISAKIHSPIFGVVQKMAVTTLPNGRHVEAIRISADGRQFTIEENYRELMGGQWSKVVGYDPDEVTRRCA
ncbi:MAG: hypothetical protein R2875_09485 [Desulfobacterales bacterium]